jgi:hypothetical protein
MVREAALDAKVELYHTHNSLVRQLRRAMRGDLIAVLVAENGEELKHLLSAEEFIDGIPVILILPDQERETVSAGHRLRPRFVSFLNSDFKDVSAVLGKMLERAEILRLSAEGSQGAGNGLHHSGWRNV